MPTFLSFRTDQKGSPKPEQECISISRQNLHLAPSGLMLPGLREDFLVLRSYDLRFRIMKALFITTAGSDYGCMCVWGGKRLNLLPPWAKCTAFCS